jgi:restriction system protein
MSSYPDAVKYMPLIVKALLAYGGSAKASVVKEWVAQKIEADGGTVPETVLKSGANKFQNDLQWGRLYLINGGWLETKDNAGYGVWKLTGDGWSSRLDEAGARAIYDVVKKKPGKHDEEDKELAPTQLQIKETADWNVELHDILTGMKPGSFESLCMKIMMESGFEPHGLPTHINSPDGGIDGQGMMSVGESSLIKIKVSWQCKRFNGKPVGAQAVRDFRGAFDGKTQYGLIFASTAFTKEAQAEASRAGATPVELIDIERIIGILKKLEMGVSTTVVTTEVTTVDKRYFDTIGQYSSADMLLGLQ